MTRPVQFIEHDQALAEASTLMLATGASLLIVTKQSQPIGVLSAQDLMLSPPRHVARIPVVVSVTGHALAQGLNYNAMIVQLNHVGALIESAAKLTPKTNVVLAFSISGQNTPLTIRGKVLACENLETELAEASPEPPPGTSMCSSQTSPPPTSPASGPGRFKPCPRPPAAPDGQISSIPLTDPRSAARVFPESLALIA